MPATKAKDSPAVKMHASVASDSSRHAGDHSQDSAVRASELEKKLNDKDQLVAALTQRLELAAEQLDRVQRTGSNRGPRAAGGGSGVPAELLEQQKSLTEELQRAVAQWEHLQLGASVGRIELQLTELRDLMTECFRDADHRRVDSAAADSHPSGSVTVSSFQYAAFAVEEHRQHSAPSLAQPTTLVSRPADTDHSESASATAIDLTTVDPPQPIDLETADVEQLRSAVEVRDAYISVLCNKLRASGLPQRLPENWDSLQHVPDDLRARLEELEGQLKESLRVTEVDLSLRRARLTREESQLHAKITQVERQLKRQGSGAAADADKHGQPTDEPGRRWLSFLSKEGQPPSKS